MSGKDLNRLCGGGYIMDDETVRYWPRVGMYITQEFADEWIERLAATDGHTGKYLEDEIEEYVQPSTPLPSTLRKEVRELFSNPFQEGELGEDIVAIIALDRLEKSKVSRIKQLKSEGYTLEEAKEMFQKEIDEATALIMGLEDLKQGAEDDGGSSSSDESE